MHGYRKSSYLYSSTEDSRMVLSIIIVNYNALPFTIHCLHSVMQAKKHLWDSLEVQTEVIVVDNNSTQDDISLLSTYFPEIILIQNKQNLGFSKANNIGLKQSTGEIVLFLNPDTLIQENSLTVSVRALLNHPQRGAIGVRMIDAEGKFLPESKRGYPSLWASFTKMSNLYRLLPKSTFLNGYYAPSVNENQNGKVKVLSGAYLMVRKKILTQVGGFDERYFMYGEDIDLCVQIEKLGYENWYLGEHTIIHYKGESTVKDQRYIERFYGAMNLFLEKYHPFQAKIFRAIIQRIIKTKSQNILKEINGKTDSSKEKSNQFEFVNAVQQNHQSPSYQSIVLVWYLKKEDDIIDFIQFLEKEGSRRKGIHIEGYPYYIELASSTQKSGYYPL